MSTFPGYADTAALDLTDISQTAWDQIRARLVDGSFGAYADAASRVRHCTHPVRLIGSSRTIDAASGQVLSTYDSDQAPLGVTMVACGNRREASCPACSRVYAADTFHLIRAGVAGGKGVPDSVSANPLVFATLTAPSFGTVHTIRSDGGPCRPFAPAAGQVCPHGRSRVCPTVHSDGDELVGQPICADCYDYDGHVVWQWWAPELWKRFTIALRRGVARRLGVSASRLGKVAAVQYAKVAEYQWRGVVHFHALIRLDGPKSAEGFAAAPPYLTATDLTELVAEAARSVWFEPPPVFAADVARVLRFGRQLDVRPVRVGNRDGLDGGLSAEQVAGYIAKYATKSATGSGDDWDIAHYRRLRATVAELDWEARVQARRGNEGALRYERLGKWEHMLGFRGHFSTKSRRYSVTLGLLRRARRRYHMLDPDARELDAAELEAALLAPTEDTTLVVGSWTFAGVGWRTEGDAALARAAAARAREYDRWRADQRRAHHQTARSRP